MEVSSVFDLKLNIHEFNSSSLIYLIKISVAEFIVFVQLETEPPTIQAGLHENESAATQQAALNVLQFLEIMA